MSFCGNRVPAELRLGTSDGFYEVSGIEDPAIRQRWVPRPVQDFENLVLAGRVAQDAKPYDAILGLSRGGLTTAQALAYASQTKRLLTMQTDGYDTSNQPIFPPRITSAPNPEQIPRGMRFLVADELVDRGGALVVAVEWIQEYCDPAAVDTAAVYVKDRERLITPTHSVRLVEDAWLDFETQASMARRADRLAELGPHVSEMTAVHGWLSLQAPNPDVVPTLIAQSSPCGRDGLNGSNGQ